MFHSDFTEHNRTATCHPLLKVYLNICHITLQIHRMQNLIGTTQQNYTTTGTGYYTFLKIKIHYTAHIIKYLQHPRRLQRKQTRM
jgi:hypothetical protein